MSLYDYNKRLKGAEKRIEDASYSEHDKEIIFRYEDDLFADDLSAARVSKYLYQLNRLRILLGVDFEEATERNLKNLVGKIQRDQGFRASTKKDYKICLRKFYRWLKPDEYSSLLEWLTIKEKLTNSKLPEDLLTEADVLEMIEVANHLRDKALVATLYETGARVGEMAGLKIKHVHFDDFGAQLMLDGKTGMRRVRTVLCVPYLSSWLATHPYRDNPDSYVWINISVRGYGKPLNYSGYNLLLKRLAKKAGINKRIHPHLFRHSRCTILAQHLTEAQLEKYAGWVCGSDMAGTYVHLSGKDVDDAILKVYGMVKEEAKPQISSKECSRCGTINEVTNKICKKCGLPFDIKDAIELGEKSDDLSIKLVKTMEQHPELKSIFSDLTDEDGD